jgi:hypothetical protein
MSKKKSINKKNELMLNFKFEEGKFYLNKSDSIILKVIKVFQEDEENTIKIYCDFISLINPYLTKIDKNTTLWFYYSNNKYISILNVENFQEISKDIYNNITKQLMSLEEEKKSIHNKQLNLFNELL